MGSSAPRPHRASKQPQPHFEAQPFVNQDVDGRFPSTTIDQPPTRPVVVNSKMAGLPHHKMAMDPALTRLGNMITNRYKYFRWTKRTAWISFVYVLAVPAAVTYLGWKSDGLYDLRAKRKGDTVYER